MKISMMLALALGVVLSAGVSSAASYTSDGSCNVIIDVDPDADSCIGLVSGNIQQEAFDVNSDTFDGVVGLFGYTDWVEIQKDENFEGGSTGVFDIVANAFDTVSVLLKSGNEWSAYLFDNGLSEVTLEYFTANGLGLSNYLVVGRYELSEIPLPGSAFLLMGGLAGLAMVRRRKRA